MNDILSMSAFVTTVEAGSFTAAERQLNTAKSVIAARVNQLEEHI